MTRERVGSTVPNHLKDFPGGPVVGNLPFNAGDVYLISGRGSKIPHAIDQLRSCTAAKT